MDRKITDIFPWQHGSSAAINDGPAGGSSGAKVIHSLSNEMVLCLDRNPSGGDFSFDMLVCSMLAKNTSVILMSFNHPKQHYELILHKNVSSISLPSGA
jgi:hypothetical protein